MLFLPNLNQSLLFCFEQAARMAQVPLMASSLETRRDVFRMESCIGPSIIGRLSEGIRVSFTIKTLSGDAVVLSLWGGSVRIRSY